MIAARKGPWPATRCRDGNTTTQVLLLCMLAALALPPMTSLGRGLETSVAEHTRAQPLVGSRTQAAGAVARAARVAQEAVRAGAHAVSYRYVPGAPIAWRASELESPLKTVWKAHAARIGRAGRARNLPQAVSIQLGPQLTAFVEDLFADIVRTVGTQGISNFRVGAEEPAALFSQAAATALFSIDEAKFPHHELIARALQASGGTPEAVGLASRIDALRDLNRKLPYDEDVVRLLYDLPDETDDAVVASKLDELMRQHGVRPTITPDSIRLIYGEGARLFEADFGRTRVRPLADDHFTRFLPRPGTRAYGELLFDTRRQLKRQGFAVVATGQFFPEGAIEELSSELPYVRSARIHPTRDSAQLRGLRSDRLERDVTGAIREAFLNYRTWQEQFMSDVLQIPLEAGQVQLEFVRRSDKPLIGMRGKSPETRWEYVDTAHPDDVALGLSTVFGKRTTLVYPDLAVEGPASNFREVPAGTRTLVPASGDMVLLMGLRAPDYPELEHWFQGLTAHGSSHLRDTRLWVGLSLKPQTTH